jgi:molybdenum cofactor synthesis domain-containing protein
MISSLVKEFGGEVVDFGICPDVKYNIRKRLRKALHCDMVVISGGSSVGTKDFVPEIINEMGRPGVLVHGVAMRPGSPTALAVVNGKPIISAPGYPVSAFFAFFTFGRPVLTQILRVSLYP